ncbi:MAG: glycine cleavage system protein GcvH [Candidatus Zophobacter franzmannii]|nr:glycine cleavage system protein GcvH [Candidatus Zophobacter franzmannii]
MKILDDLFYTETHEWVKLEGDTAYVGITDFAQQELGEIVYVELPEAGDTVTSGEPFGSVETSKAVEDVNSPISGEVLSVNSELEDSAETVNNSPFEDGWLIKVRLSDKNEISKLISAAAYKKIIEG